MTEDPCGRTLWFVENIDVPSDEIIDTDNSCVQCVTDEEKVVANVYGSRVDPIYPGDTQEWHAPALDIDFPARLLPSSTEGHFHLYLDKIMYWEDYAKLLRVMAEVGILEQGYVTASLERKMTCLRKPGLVKPKKPKPE
jgi:hypothetical protein